MLRQARGLNFKRPTARRVLRSPTFGTLGHMGLAYLIWLGADVLGSSSNPDIGLAALRMRRATPRSPGDP